LTGRGCDWLGLHFQFHIEFCYIHCGTFNENANRKCLNCECKCN